MFLIGVPWNEAGTAGGLFGTKIVLNEFVAFIDLGAMAAGSAQRPEPGDRHLRAVRLRQFQLDRDPDGGDRRPRAQPAADDRQARHQALIAGSLANLMSAALAGLLLP